MLRFVVFALLLGVCASAGKQQKKKETPQSLSRGWGDGIRWVKSYKEGLSEMVKSKKPLMVIHHQDICPYSALKKAFAADKSIQKMAGRDFIMLNLLNETADERIAPDGRYTPRILFLDQSNTVRTELVGKKFPSHLYTYEPADMTLCE
uniref:Ag1 n=1 Tax=Gasterosteus aculeatus TaxID=69293 RepID=M1RGE7_GASAC|nr:ag1 [Gasterosteus aculeatus]